MYKYVDGDKKIIEINGVLMEVDLSAAKIIENYRIGDNVKVLVKKYSGYESYPGVIIGFDNFPNLPSIVICYCTLDYHPKIEFLCFNKETKDIEICHMHEHEKILDKKRTIDILDRDIFKKELELDEAKRSRNYFVEKYNHYLDVAEGGNFK